MAKRKQSEAQLENLKLGTPFTAENARSAAAKAAEARKKYRPLKEIARDALPEEEWAAILSAIKERALDGDIRAAEFLRDTSGEKPKEEVEMNAGIKFAFESIEDWDELSG